MKTRRGLFGLIAGAAAMVVGRASGAFPPRDVTEEILRAVDLRAEAMKAYEAAKRAKTDSTVLGSLHGYKRVERLNYMTAREIQSMREYAERIQRLSQPPAAHPSA